MERRSSSRPGMAGWLAVLNTGYRTHSSLSPGHHRYVEGVRIGDVQFRLKSGAWSGEPKWWATFDETARECDSKEEAIGWLDACAAVYSESDPALLRQLGVKPMRTASDIEAERKKRMAHTAFLAACGAIIPYGR